MAKIRSVKPDLFRHPGLFKAELASGLPLRLAFIGLFTACDREGRFAWVPETLKLDCLPFDNVDFSAVMDALESSGFVIRYVVDNKVYGCIPTWKKHQHINAKEAESKLPDSGQGIHLPCPVNSPDGSGNGGGGGREVEMEVEVIKTTPAPSGAAAPVLGFDPIAIAIEAIQAAGGVVLKREPKIMALLHGAAKKLGEQKYRDACAYYVKQDYYLKHGLSLKGLYGDLDKCANAAQATKPVFKPIREGEDVF